MKKSYKVSISTPSVSPFVQNSVLAYYESGTLNKFYTSFVEHEGNKLAKNILKLFPSYRGLFARRSFSSIPWSFFETRPFPEILRSISSHKLNSVITDFIWEYAELSFDKWVASKIDNSMDAIHTYEFAALATLIEAKKKGVMTIYEQPSLHHSFYTPIIRNQIEKYSFLKSITTKHLYDDKSIRRNVRRDKELNLADIVICNSSLTKRTLINSNINESKVMVIPLGFPKPVVRENGKALKKVVFLSAGTQSLLKGSHILYLAWRQCNFSDEVAELWLIGNMQLPAELRWDLPGTVFIKDSIPHSELMELYSMADVFIMPTLSDGFGLVITEAMSRGVPVIATLNSAGPDIINHMVDGWIIEPGQVEALATQMKWCVANSDSLNDFGKAALIKADSWQWEDYRRELVLRVNEKISEFKE